MTAPRLGPGLWTARAMWGSIRPQPLPPSYTTTGDTNRNLSGAELPWRKVFNHTNCHRIFRKYIVRLKFDGPNRRTLEIGQMLGGQLVAREN